MTLKAKAVGYGLSPLLRACVCVCVSTKSPSTHCRALQSLLLMSTVNRNYLAPNSVPFPKRRRTAPQGRRRRKARKCQLPVKTRNHVRYLVPKLKIWPRDSCMTKTPWDEESCAGASWHVAGCVALSRSIQEIVQHEETSTGFGEGRWMRRRRAANKLRIPCSTTSSATVFFRLDSKHPVAPATNEPMNCAVFIVLLMAETSAA